ncbi:OLC1v1011204C1 [Oldenlandia corymbosa var. corymbosa]|uniref:OLC1v1011204C1 n=1 Tax=Oldenlandia corymbosa var. corymbosa TaxID=529605 RepID=A0AAV1DTC6_OLDCO|nr:OLC1v1011204C1 [Oldenlandia corymbosa var. corymbosa]
MAKFWIIWFLFLVFLISGCSSASATPAAKIVGGVVTNVASALFKWLWSLKSTTKPEISSRSMMKFEGGYTVETVFDGSKLGIEPYSVEVSPSGDLLVLDSQNSNVYKMSTPLSRYSKPKLVAGSPEGYSGHVDGRPRESRMNHPKGLTIDDRGNIYVADTMNMAIRKISDNGVVTIAGGKWSRGGGHIDGPSEDAKFSDDFDLVYVASSCSLLIVDRGNQAIREIQLHDGDCSEHQVDDQTNLGIAVLVAAGFFGYMLALLQRRVAAIFSSDSLSDTITPVKGMPAAPYQRHHPQPIRPPLIPTQGEYEKPEEDGLFSSLGRLFVNTGSSVLEIFGGLFSGSRKKPSHHHLQQQYHHRSRQSSNAWPMQESYVIPDGDEPPSVESRDHTPRKVYPMMTKDIEKSRHHKQSRPNYYGGWNADFHQQQQQQYHPQVQAVQQLHKHHQHQDQQHQQHQHQQHHQKHQTSRSQTYYEQNCEANEIVFGAVQEQDGRREAMVIKAVDYSDPMYNNNNIRSRYNYMGYSSYGY